MGSCNSARKYWEWEAKNYPDGAFDQFVTTYQNSTESGERRCEFCYKVKWVTGPESTKCLR